MLRWICETADMLVRRHVVDDVYPVSPGELYSTLKKCN